MSVEVGSSGMSLGAAIAVTVSWSVNKHLGWAIMHGILGWLYVLYYACGGGH